MGVCVCFVIQVPHVNRTDYQLIDISEDGFVCHLLLLLLFKSVFNLNFGF